LPFDPLSKNSGGAPAVKQSLAADSDPGFVIVHGKVLLGHKSGDITTHDSGPELEELLEAANLICGNGSRKSPALVVLRKRMA